MATTLAFDLIAHDRASDKFNKIGNSASSVGSKFAKMGRIAAIGTAALAAGAVVAGKALFEMTKNAAADEAAQRKLALGIKNATDATDAQIMSVERWITAQGKALGVTDDELRPALQRLVEATGDVDEAQRQLGIAMDVSAGTGKSLKTVSEALMKANNGTTASLSKLGLKTKDANGEALSLDAALKKMADTFEGQAAAKAGTLEGKMARLNLMWDEAKESIGARLIPKLTELSDWFMAKGVPAITKFGGVVDAKVMPVLADMAQSVVPKIKAALEAALPAIVNLGKAGVALGQTFGPVVMSLASTLTSTLIPAFAAVAGAVANVGKFLAEHKTTTIALASAIGVLVAITKIHAAVLAVQAAGGILAMIKATKIATVATKVWAAGQWVLNAALAANPIGLVVIAIAALVAGLVIAYKRSETFRNIVNGAFKSVANAAQAAFGWIKDNWKLLVTVIAGPIGIAALLVAKHWDKIKAGAQALKAVVVGAFNAMKGPIMAIGGWVSWLVGRINEAISAINSLQSKAGSSGALGPLGSLLGNARGTNNWRGGMTLVGEEGPEIVDLPRGSRIHSAPASRSMMRGSGGGDIDYRRLAQEIVAAMREGAPLVRLENAGQGAYLSGA